MPLGVKVQSFLRNVFSGRRADAELNEEVRAHLELLIDEMCARGCRRKKRDRQREWNWEGSNR